MAEVSYTGLNRGDGSRMLFGIIGWLTCQLTGQADKYAVLMAQAKFETDNFTSRKWRLGSGAWCMHYSATGTPRAAGGDATGGESVAVYTNFFTVAQMWAMWRDRLDWDVRRGINPGTYNDAQSYLRKVVDANWRGYNTPELGPGGKQVYINSVMSWYRKLPPGIKAIGGVGDGETSKVYKVIQVIFWLVVVGVIGWILLKAYSFVRKSLKA